MRRLAAKNRYVGCCNAFARWSDVIGNTKMVPTSRLFVTAWLWFPGNAISNAMRDRWLYIAYLLMGSRNRTFDRQQIIPKHNPLNLEVECALSFDFRWIVSCASNSYMFQYNDLDIGEIKTLRGALSRSNSLQEFALTHAGNFRTFMARLLS